MSTTTTIIQKVKEELNIVEEISDVDLLVSFKLYIASNHPDKYTDKQLKKEAEEKCKNLNVLYDELKKYIEQKRLKEKALVGYNPEDIVKFDYINEVDAKDKEITRLKNNNLLFEMKLEDANNNIRQLNEKLEGVLASKSDENKQSIKEIYRPRKPINVAGIAVFVASICAVIPQCQELLESLNLPAVFISWLLIGVSSLWILSWMRSLVVEKIVDSVESYILTSPVDNELKLHYRETYNSKDYERYFTDVDMSEYVRKLLSKRSRKYIILYDMNKTVRLMTEQILLELDRKKLIKSVESDEFTKIFVLNKADKIY